MDTVFIEGLEIEALIGIYDWERRIRQPLVFDLEMQFDNTLPAASDAIADTLDYKAVSKRVIEFVGQSGYGLVETLAEHVAAIVLEEFGVERVRLKLSKPGAVRGARAVGVIIERTRQPGAPRRAQATPTAVAMPEAIAAPVATSAPEIEAAAFAAAVPRGAAAPIVAAAEEPVGAPVDATPVQEASDEVAPVTDETVALEASNDVTADEPASVEADASSVPVEATESEAAPDGVEPVLAETAEPVVEDAAEQIATSAAADTADTTAAAVTAAATHDDGNGHSPLEAALLAAVSGWHSPRPAPTGLDAALNALGEKGARNGRKPKAAPATPPAATPVSAWQPPALSPADDARPAVSASPPLPPELPPAPETASAPATAPAAPRANFMRDLDDAPMRPVTIAASTEPTPSRSPVPAAGSEPEPAPAATAPPPPAEVAGATKTATPAAPTPAPAAPSRAAVTPTVRTAPPPPPRPRNPASDLGRTTRPAYLSLGSNIEPEKNLRSALMALRARFGEVIVSPVYRMTAVGFEGPDFLNAAAIIDSDLDPFALTRWLHGIESAHGRIRSHVKNSSRTLDMDIIFFDDLVLDMPGGLQLPRPELRHAFVLKPLVDIAPGFIDPVRGVPLADVWASHAERETKFSTVII